MYNVQFVFSVRRLKVQIKNQFLVFKGVPGEIGRNRIKFFFPVLRIHHPRNFDSDPNPGSAVKKNGSGSRS